MSQNASDVVMRSSKGTERTFLLGRTVVLSGSGRPSTPTLRLHHGESGIYARVSWYYRMNAGIARRPDSPVVP